MTEFFPPSPQMLEKIANKAARVEMKYPWASVPIGKSFVIPYNDIKLTTLKPHASRMGKKLGRKFLVVDHPEDQIYEVGCISERNPPQSLPKPVEGSSTVVGFPTSPTESPTNVGTIPDFGFDK